MTQLAHLGRRHRVVANARAVVVVAPFEPVSAHPAKLAARKTPPCPMLARTDLIVAARSPAEA